ncbi:MAG: hypothetical protein KAT15_14335 [Bacteroidales bacterium]|nr:hypothetical protein [Bacteroidales bacterium]
MYYLIVRNLGAPRCIDRNKDDVYEDGMSFECNPQLDCSAKEFVKEVEITCIEHPDDSIIAMVFRD